MGTRGQDISVFVGRMGSGKSRNNTGPTRGRAVVCFDAASHACMDVHIHQTRWQAEGRPCMEERRRPETS